MDKETETYIVVDLLGIALESHHRGLSFDVSSLLFRFRGRLDTYFVNLLKPHRRLKAGAPPPGPVLHEAGLALNVPIVLRRDADCVGDGLREEYVCQRTLVQI